MLHEGNYKMIFYHDNNNTEYNIYIYENGIICMNDNLIGHLSYDKFNMRLKIDNIIYGLNFIKLDNNYISEIEIIGSIKSNNNYSKATLEYL